MATLTITNLAEAKAVLADPSKLADARSIWVGNFDDSIGMLGAYTMLERCHDAETRRERVLPWRLLMAKLADRSEALSKQGDMLDTFAIHHSALVFFASNWTDRSGLDKQDHQRKQIEEEVYCRAYEEKHASRMKVRHLIVSGHSTFDHYLKNFTVQESITFRGCYHSLNTLALNYLLEMDGIRTVNFQGRSDFVGGTLTWLQHNVCWLQRSRILLKRQPYKLFRVYADVSDESCQAAKDRWARTEPPYTCGAKFEVIPTKFSCLETTTETELRAWKSGVGWDDEQTDEGEQASEDEQEQQKERPDDSFPPKDSTYCQCARHLDNDQGSCTEDQWVAPPMYLLHQSGLGYLDPDQYEEFQKLDYEVHSRDDDDDDDSDDSDDDDDYDDYDEYHYDEYYDSTKHEHERQAQDRLELVYRCWNWDPDWTRCMRCGMQWNNSPNEHECWYVWPKADKDENARASGSHL